MERSYNVLEGLVEQGLCLLDNRSPAPHVRADSVPSVWPGPLPRVHPTSEVAYGSDQPERCDRRWLGGWPGAERVRLSLLGCDLREGSRGGASSDQPAARGAVHSSLDRAGFPVWLCPGVLVRRNTAQVRAWCRDS